MPTDTTVKFFNSSMAGCPSLSGSPGALLAVLQACLVDGWGAAPVDSVVVASGVATVTRGSGHPFVDGQVALMAGATPIALNGEKKVTVINSTKYTFDATGVPDGSATGTITHKVAGAGWMNPYASAGSIGVFKSTDPAASGCVLRVDDSGAKVARVLGYESMSDLNTGGGGAPYLVGQGFPTHVVGGLYWGKSDATSAATRNWWLVADARAFYLMTAYTNGYGSYATVCFGDFASVRAATYDCVLYGHSADPTASGSGGNAWELDVSDGSTVNGVCLPRSYTNVGGPPTAFGYRCAPTLGQNTISQRSGASGMMPYPNGADGGVYVAPMYLSEPFNRVTRGSFAGFYFIANATGATMSNGSRLSGVVNLPGRQLLTLISQTGSFAFDVTGPWAR